MFENLIKSLKRLEGERQISVPIEADNQGYWDKQCPSKSCEFIFKVHGEDWVNLVSDESVWCPFCRHEASADQWFTIDQVEHSRSEALRIVGGEIHNAMLQDARRFNQTQPKRGFLTMSLEVKGGHKSTVPLPAIAAEAMQLEILCESCNCRFAVIGSAYFCPACGHNSVVNMYESSLRKIEAKLDNLDLIKKTLVESGKKDEAELVTRSLAESCLSDGVTAFQKYCDGLYKPFGKAPMNAFQRLKQGNGLWTDAIGEGYLSWITTDEYSGLEVLFQKRHVLAHNDGIVDEAYMQRSGDSNYRAGQRIVVSQDDIRTLLGLLQRVGNGLRHRIAALGRQEAG